MDISRTSGIEGALSGGRLTVDLGALVRNWRKLSALAPETAAVVKADAYGLGAEPVVNALYKAGCRTFFVAFAHEGAAIRPLTPEARIFVLTGTFGNDLRIFEEFSLIPLICSNEQLSAWLAGGGAAPFGLHVDTGMNRLGFSLAEAHQLSARRDALARAGLCHIMSHLACADDAAHPKNTAQLESFQQVRAAFSKLESSLCNSAGIFLGADYLCDLTRPGIALYGGVAVNGAANPMEPVVTAQSRVIQIRQAKAGETVSYGATLTLRRDTRIAVCGTGYADGFHRAAGTGTALRAAGISSALGSVNGVHVPVIGRVTMDLTMFDVTDLPARAISTNGFVELFGRAIALDDAARACGTIGYELLTSLGRRYERRYFQETP